MDFQDKGRALIPHPSHLNASLSFSSFGLNLAPHIDEQEFISLKRTQSIRRQSRSQSSIITDVDSSQSSPQFSLSVSSVAESEGEDEDGLQLDEHDSVIAYERELNALGSTTVSRGSLQILIHASRQTTTYWFELLHVNRLLNYYRNNSNHRSSFVSFIAMQCAAIISCSAATSFPSISEHMKHLSSSPPQYSFIISIGGTRQGAPIHHVVTPPSPSAFAFWLDAFASVVDSCLSRDAIDLRRRKTLLLHRLEQMRLQRPSLQLIGASLQELTQTTASSPQSSFSAPASQPSQSSASASASAQAPSSPLSSAISFSSSSSSSLPKELPSLFIEEGDGGEAFRECLVQVLLLMYFNC
jgi:hypothetical protein